MTALWARNIKNTQAELWDFKFGLPYIFKWSPSKPSADSYAQAQRHNTVIQEGLLDISLSFLYLAVGAYQRPLGLVFAGIFGLQFVMTFVRWSRGRPRRFVISLAISAQAQCQLHNVEQLMAFL
jgi:hypothetical protein